MKLIDQILAIPSESRTIEFKRLGSRNETIDKTLRSIVAMANTDGGLVILGVDDPTKTRHKGLGRVIGIEENLELFDELGKNIKKIMPPISQIWPPQYIPISEKGVRIALLFIPKVTDCFRSYENHVYIRLERGNKRLSPQEIVQFTYVKGFERADRELVDVDFSLLETTYYQAWRKNRNITDHDIRLVLEKTGLARKEKKSLLPTRAAVLLFAEFPNDLMDTKCTIRILQYEDSNEGAGIP